MKKLVRSVLLVASIVAVLAVVAIGVISMSATPAEAGPCRCPQIYAPVVCDNGKTYPNQCVADCHHGRNCVPTGEI